MNNRLITIAVIVAGVLIAIGVNLAVRQSTSTGDAESLRAQQKAAGVPENVTSGRGPSQMFASLKLSEDQKTKVDAVMKEMQTAMRNGPRPDASSGANQEQMFARMQEMRTKQEAKLKEILTAEQFAQFQKEQQERMANMPPMGGGPMSGPPMGMPPMGGGPMGGSPMGGPPIGGPN